MFQTFFKLVSLYFQKYIHHLMWIRVSSLKILLTEVSVGISQNIELLMLDYIGDLDYVPHMTLFIKFLLNIFSISLHC
jgi:hypothetical protein